MSELTTTSLLALFETNKEQRMDFVLRVIDALDSGTVDPLKIHLQVKCMEGIVKGLNENTVYKSHILGAAEKQGQKSFEFHNSKMEIKEVGVKYDFSKCEDIGLNAMYDQLALLESKIKQRETMLKALSPKGLTITDEDTGETYTVYPPAKSSTTSVTVTLK
jgi:hypothetical protein